MIRRERTPPPTSIDSRVESFRAQLSTRRQFLIAAAGGSMALLFGPRLSLAQESQDPWPILAAVLDHLLPSEPDIPGAKEINALGYLRFVASDPTLDPEERHFITQGAGWLNDLAMQRNQRAFERLSHDEKEQLLRQIVKTPTGENWVSTVLTYLFEALLTAPAYGGNTDGIGWRWLEYVPGFPLPEAGSRYTELPL